MSQFEIRQAHKKDADQIVSLLHQLGYKSDSTIIRKLILKSLSVEDDILVGVQKEDVIAVMTLIYFDYFPSAERFCRITSIVVDEDLRGRGLGTQMIDYAKSRALTKGCSVIELTTSMLREQTHGYYESIGFRKTSYKYVQELGSKI